MDVFLLTGKDPNDEENPVKTWIVVADRELDARKLLPGHFEVYEIEVRTGELGGLAGCHWMDGRTSESLMTRLRPKQDMFRHLSLSLPTDDRPRAQPGQHIYVQSGR
jgi:hypothetical protein